MSKIRLHGSSSGYTEIAPVAASGNNTLTLPNDGTIISKDSNGAVGVTSITVGTGVTIGDGRITCSTLHGSAANCTLIPAANIVGLATAGFNRSGGFPSGIEMVDMWRLHTEYTIPTNSTTVVSTANWERPDTTNDGFNQLGTGMSVNSGAHADGVWTFPSTGFYLVSYGGYCYNGSNDPYEVFIRLEFTEDGSSFGLQGRAYIGGERYNYNGGFAHIIVDVTDVSTHKFRMRVYSAVSDSRLHGESTGNRNYVSFIRLGDT